jgi:hypothetical protein
MNEDQPRTPPGSISQVELAAAMSVMTLAALFIGLNFERWARQSLPSAIAGLLLVPLLLSVVFRLINAWKPSRRMNVLLILCLVSVALCVLAPYLVNFLTVANFLPSPPSHALMAVITDVLGWVAVAFLALYTLALGVTLVFALGAFLLRNPPDRHPGG